MDDIVTVDDIIKLFRPLDASEKEKAEALIPVVCDSLRQEAKMVGKDIDEMLTSGELLENVFKSVVADVVGRTLMTSTNSEPMTQTSQSALGYTVSGTFLVPGGGLFIKKSELARLGLKRQKYGVIDFYDD
nr:MAG TPA: hypothetical protein [Caudoviricetes sp.]